MTNTDTAKAAKFHKLANLHAAKAAEGGQRASYYAKLAEGEARRALAHADAAGLPLHNLAGDALAACQCGTVVYGGLCADCRAAL